MRARGGEGTFRPERAWMAVCSFLIMVGASSLIGDSSGKNAGLVLVETMAPCDIGPDEIVIVWGAPCGVVGVASTDGRMFGAIA